MTRVRRPLALLLLGASRSAWYKESGVMRLRLFGAEWQAESVMGWITSMRRPSPPAPRDSLAPGNFRRPSLSKPAGSFLYNRYLER
jgi:hypothetical protein